MGDRFVEEIREILEKHFDAVVIDYRFCSCAFTLFTGNYRGSYELDNTVVYGGHPYDVANLIWNKIVNDNF